MSFSTGRAALAAWLLLLAACASSAMWRAADDEWLHTSIFELLPRTEQDAMVQRATQAAEQELSRRLTFFVGHGSQDVARTVAEEFGARLAAHALIEAATVRIDDARISSFAEFYFPYRKRLLSDEQIALISADRGVSIARSAQANIYGPLAMGGSSLSADPFLLFPDSVRRLQPGTDALTLDDGYLRTAQDETEYVLVTATTTSASLGLDEQQSIVEHIAAAVRAAAASDAEVIGTGFLLFAQAGTNSAKNEVSLIGTGSLLGVVLLMWLAFRSLRPLCLALLSIGCGCTLAFAVTIWSFGSVHVTTLVFGATLVGISVDYTLHYLSHQAFGPRDLTPEQGLRRVMPGMTMGLITSVTAFLALAIAPFPGLKQLAVFASAGLCGAYATLVVSAWLWRTRLEPANRTLPRLSMKHFEAWQLLPASARIAACGVLCAGVMLGFASVEFDDDISILQDRPPELIEQERRVGRLVGALPSNTLLLVRGMDADSVLQNEERARARLDALVASGSVEGYQAVSRAVPSAARQRRSLQAYDTLLEDRLDDYLGQLGMPAHEWGPMRDRLAASGLDALTVEDWRAHAVSAGLGVLWLPEAGDGPASIVLLQGLRDAEALRQSLADLPAVTVIDKTAALSSLLGAYRVRIGWILAAALVVVLGLLTLRYGVRKAVILPLPPLLGGALALVLISAVGAPLNLFNLLALVLVFGIGIDATLFIAEADESIEPAAFAIMLSALTTLLSFGLLSLSSTYAAQSFGLTVLIGITCSYLLTPICAAAGPGERQVLEALP